MHTWFIWSSYCNEPASIISVKQAIKGDSTEVWSLSDRHDDPTPTTLIHLQRLVNDHIHLFLSILSSQAREEEGEQQQQQPKQLLRKISTWFDLILLHTVRCFEIFSGCADLSSIPISQHPRNIERQIFSHARSRRKL